MCERGWLISAKWTISFRGTIALNPNRYIAQGVKSIMKVIKKPTTKYFPHPWCLCVMLFASRSFCSHIQLRPPTPPGPPGTPLGERNASQSTVPVPLRDDSSAISVTDDTTKALRYCWVRGRVNINDRYNNSYPTSRRYSPRRTFL